MFNCELVIEHHKINLWRDTGDKPFSGFGVISFCDLSGFTYNQLNFTIFTINCLIIELFQCVELYEEPFSQIIFFKHSSKVNVQI